MDAALKYINQTLVDRPPGQITLKDLLEIHKRVIGYVDPIEAGFFRQTQVFVGESLMSFYLTLGSSCFGVTLCLYFFCHEYKILVFH